MDQKKLELIILRLNKAAAFLGSGYKVDFFKADTLSEGGSEGRIYPEGIKADIKGGGGGWGVGVRSPTAKQLKTSLSIYYKKFPIKLRFGLMTPHPFCWP